MRHKIISLQMDAFLESRLESCNSPVKTQSLKRKRQDPLYLQLHKKISIPCVNGTITLEGTQTKIEERRSRTGATTLVRTTNQLSIASHLHISCDHLLYTLKSFMINKPKQDKVILIKQIIKRVFPEKLILFVFNTKQKVSFSNIMTYLDHIEALLIEVATKKGQNTPNKISLVRNLKKEVNDLQCKITEDRPFYILCNSIAQKRGENDIENAMLGMISELFQPQPVNPEDEYWLIWAFWFLYFTAGFKEAPT